MSNRHLAVIHAVFDDFERRYIDADSFLCPTNGYVVADVLAVVKRFCRYVLRDHFADPRRGAKTPRFSIQFQLDQGPYSLILEPNATTRVAFEYCRDFSLAYARAQNRQCDSCWHELFVADECNAY